MLAEEERLVEREGRVVAELESLRVPPTIQAVLAARLDRLDEGERDVLQRASVIGEVFWWGAVAELTPPERIDAVPARLQALARKGLIRPDRETLAGEDGFRFAHILVRDAAYESLPKRRRAELHERFADWLERRAAERAGEPDELVGYHLEQAHNYRRALGTADERTVALAARAAEHLAPAGARAYARGDLPAAVDLLERSAALLPPLDPARLALLPKLGDALCDLGDLARADEVLADAVRSAAATEQELVLAHARLVRAYAHSFTDAEQGLPELRRLAEEALPTFEARGDDAGLARAWQALATVHLGACHWGAVEEARRRELDHSRRAGERGLELRALSGLAYALLFGPTPVPQAIPAVESILDEARGYPVAEGALLSILGALVSMDGRFDDARELHGRAREIFEELGPALPVAEAALNAADSELLADAPAAAEALLRPTYDRLDRMGETAILASVAALLAAALVEQDNDDDAWTFTEASERLAADDDVAAQALGRAIRSQLLAGRGEHEAAEALARDAAAIAGETDDLNLRAQTQMSLAVVLRAAGADGAAEAAGQAVRLYDEKGNVAGRWRAEREAERLTAA